jgi:single-stranded DNA-binding protein
VPGAAMSFAGNLTDDPEVRSTEAGMARAMIRVAVSGRTRDSEPSFFTVAAWRDQAEHAAPSPRRAAGWWSSSAPAADLDGRG